MNRKLIFNIVATFVVLIVVATALTFAWYTNTNKSSSVDYVSDGSVIEYTINNSSQKNVEQFDVEGVAFFDVDNVNEGFYFTDMAVCVKFTITNYSKHPVTLTLEGETQSYTLSAEVENNVVSVYSYSTDTVNTDDDHAKPTRDTFDDFEDLYTYGYDTTATKYVYEEATSYTAGETYYQREVLTSVTLTAANSKVIEATSTSQDIVATVLNSGTAVAIEKYVAVDKTSLTADIFGVGNAGFYYTLTEENDVKTYTHAKIFDSSAQYYELQTQAYLSDITVSGTSVTAIGSAVSGAYITCAISSTELESKEFNYTAVDTTGFNSSTDVSKYFVLSGGKYVAATGTYNSSTTYYNQKPILNTKSVNSFLGSTYSNRYTHSSNLPAATVTEDSSGNVTAITPGSSVVIFVYIYGVQPYDNATNNFLENTLNVYPFKLTISAE